MPCVSLQRKQAASIVSAAIELTINRVTQNNPWGRDLLTVGVGTVVGVLVGFSPLSLFISIPLAVALGYAASSIAGSKYDEYFR